MEKWLYDKLLSEYSKKSKEELMQIIMSLEEIELSDRAFANQCMAGTIMYDINELFTAINEMRNCFTFETAYKVYKLMNNARNSWNYVRHGIEEMSDSARTSKSLDDFKLRVFKAVDTTDDI